MLGVWVHARASLTRSEDNLRELVFSFHPVCSRDWWQTSLPAELSHSHKCFELEMDYQLAMPRALGYLIINYTIVKK